MRRGRRIAAIASVTGILMIGIACLTMGPVIAEAFYMHDLRQGNEAERRSAAQELGDLLSVRALRPLMHLLVESADKHHVTAGMLDLTEVHVGFVADLCFKRGTTDVLFWWERNEAVRPYVVSVSKISRCRAKEALPVLVDFLKDKHAIARLYSTLLIGEIARDDESLVPALQDLLGDGDRWVAQAASDTLLRLRKSSGDVSWRGVGGTESARTHHRSAVETAAR
jgi:HEAT repeat protein